MDSRYYKQHVAIINNLKKTLRYIALSPALLLAACKSTADTTGKKLPDRFLIVLGVAQDAGYPQLGCTKECCTAYWEGKEEKKHVTCLALVDRVTNQYWLIEATPDITEQLHALQSFLPVKNDYSPDGVFITHAHTGHYTGLLQFGREAMGAKDIPVWAMPRMDSFLRNNAPWSQLLALHNIQLESLHADSTVTLNPSLKITPVIVPHRDEFSETVGFLVESDKKKILFIPDIDKWEKWKKDILTETGKVDMALLDGTFYQDGELPGRDMSEVPHPFVQESLEKFSGLSSAGKANIVFIHFNHTNPLLKKESPEKKKLQSAGFGVAGEGMIIEM
jgi:pyrroloquinoline quinone biosynthesis protein B